MAVLDDHSHDCCSSTVVLHLASRLVLVAGQHSPLPAQATHETGELELAARYVSAGLQYVSDKGVAREPSLVQLGVGEPA